MATQKLTKSRTSKAAAGAAGAGGGTLLVVLANSLPPTNRWKPLAVLLAPVLSVALMAFFAWCKEIITPRLRKYLSDKRRQMEFSRVKSTIHKAIINPVTSPEHKEELRGQLEELEMLITRSNIRPILKELKRAYS